MLAPLGRMTERPCWNWGCNNKPKARFGHGAFCSRKCELERERKELESTQKER